MDPEVLKRLQARGAPRTGGKGTPRRTIKKVQRNSAADDRKIQAALKKINVQPITGIDEVNMFKEDGSVLHFSRVQVHAAVQSNTFAVYGRGENKELSELLPGILNQLGPESLASLRKLAESYQQMSQAQAEAKAAAGAGAGADAKEADDDEDDIPDLVEQKFDEQD
ncbi:Nascent polypeptide-associated complex subunit beta [Savitreella phatthalungensis]